MATDLLAIINPLSGTLSLAQKERLRAHLLRQATERGFRPEAVLTTHAGHATELATHAVRAGVSRILAVGGDGTMNETARVLRHTRTALGLVPLGSGNGLARHLGLPLRPLAAIERALRGRPVVIDSAEIGGHPFFCTAGVGFDAHVAHLFARQPVRGLTTYIRTAYRAFWTYRPRHYVVNNQPQTLFSLTYANAGQFGNGAWIAPTANIADGQLEECGIRPFPKHLGAWLGWQLFSKSIHRSAYWRGQSVQTATVRSDEPLLIHADGEPIALPGSVVDIRTRPGSLLVLL